MPGDGPAAEDFSLLLEDAFGPSPEIQMRGMLPFRLLEGLELTLDVARIVHRVVMRAGFSTLQL